MCEMMVLFKKARWLISGLVGLVMSITIIMALTSTISIIMVALLE